MTNVISIFFTIEHAPVQVFLEIPRQLSPVGSNRFQPLVMNRSLTLPIVDQTSVAFFTTLIRAPHGGHEELIEVGFKLHFEIRFDIVILAQMIDPISIDQAYETVTNFGRHFVIAGFLQGDENRICIAVNHFVAFGLDQLHRLQNNGMATFGDRTGQSRIMNTAARSPQHTVKRIHDNFYRLRQCRITIPFRLITRLPKGRYDVG